MTPKDKSRKKGTRRGFKKRKQYTEELTITGTNANGLKCKKQSFINLLKTDNPQVFMIQETKLRKKNQFTIPGYALYEKVRKGRGGGGIMIGIKKDIQSVPVIISDHDDEVEILVIEVALKSMPVRFLTAYGPQEDASEDSINKFYSALEEELSNCEQGRCGLIAELDCNAKLGKEIVRGDPNEMSSNGKILWEIMERQKCTIVNTTEKCSGSITRSRMKKNIQEESVLDYVFVNALITPFINNMEIDEFRQKTLTRYTKCATIPSDHNILKCTFDIPI